MLARGFGIMLLQLGKERLVLGHHHFTRNLPKSCKSMQRFCAASSALSWYVSIAQGKQYYNMAMSVACATPEEHHLATSLKLVKRFCWKLIRRLMGSMLKDLGDV